VGSNPTASAIVISQDIGNPWTCRGCWLVALSAASG